VSAELEMLTLIEDLPETVVGVEAHGKVTSEDYERLLAPAVEAAMANTPDGRIRLLYVVGHEFPDYTAGAAWEDAKLGLGHVRSWERIAIVGDADWLRHAVHGFGWLMPGEIRVFALEQLDSARAWVTSMLPDQVRIY
jgi:SpoIIAA-like